MRIRLFSIVLSIIGLFMFWHCDKAMATKQPQPVTVAVIDTGISTTAMEDALIPEGTNLICPNENTQDKVGHGTAVADIIYKNCENVRLVPIVWSTENEQGSLLSGDASMIADAIYLAVDEYDCSIINISSGTGEDNDKLKEAVEYAIEKGCLIVSCAGNRYFGGKVTVYYPGGYDGVLCAGSADENGRVSSFSQQTSVVDLLAPGENLHLLTPKGTKIRGEGTSFSTAYVTGAAALILYNNPGMTGMELYDAVLSCTDNIDGKLVLNLEKAGEYRVADNTSPQILIWLAIPVTFLAFFLLGYFKKQKN